MRFSLILLCFPVFLFCSFKATEKPSDARVLYGLKGHVKSVFETKHSNGPNSGLDSSVINFNKEGNLLSRKWFDSDSLSQTLTCIYDKIGNLVLRNFYWKDGRLLWQDSMFYDRNGNLVEHWFSQLELTIKYIYNKDGDTLHQMRIKPDGVIIDQIRFEYNKSRQKITETHYNRKMDSIYYHFLYDDNGNLVQKKIRDLVYESYEYNGQNKLVLKITTKPFLYETDVYAQYNTYGPGGNLIETIDSAFINTEGQKSCTITNYDDYGNITSKRLIKTYSDGQRELLTTFEYEYDKQKNWIKKTETRSDSTWIVTTRVIKYY